MRFEILKIEIARDFVEKRETETSNRDVILNFYAFTCLPSHKLLMNALSLSLKFGVDYYSGEIYFSVFRFVESPNI